MRDPTERGESIVGVVSGLHHVAIVVPDLASARQIYEGVLGLTACGDIEHVPNQKVNVLVLMAGEQRIELVEPSSPDSPVSRFLEKRGGGIHHMAYRVESIEAAIDSLMKQGVRMIDERPRDGSHHTRIAFVHPKSTGGVLVELVEDPPHAT